jgi:hypothetical protein
VYPAKFGPLNGTELVRTGASYVNEYCTVPSWVEMVATTCGLDPLPAAVKQASVVADDHPIVEHEVSPIRAEGVTSACAKLSPLTELIANPEVAPFQPRMLVGTGASKVKLFTIVPISTVSTTSVTGMAAELGRVLPAVLHAMDESDVQLVVRHSSAESITTDAVVSKYDRKLSPSSVVEIGPNAGTFAPCVKPVATGVSNEKLASWVPTAPLTVTEKCFA